MAVQPSAGVAVVATSAALVTAASAAVALAQDDKKIREPLRFAEIFLGDYFKNVGFVNTGEYNA
jgi:hypothetical protein